MSNPLIVYTAITASFNDKLRPIIAPKDLSGREVRYICFSDRFTALAGSRLGWEVRPPQWRHDDSPRRTARWHKINSHLLFPEAEVSLWVDGSHQPRENPWGLVDEYLSNANIATFKHGDRSCLYEELEACIKLKKDDPDLMRRQVQVYRSLDYPVRNGLFETSVVFRRHCDETRKFNDRWWQEIAAGSYRDQLSVNWVAHHLKLKVAIVKGNRMSSPHFAFHAHR